MVKCSERVAEAERGELLELPVAMMVVAAHTVVETRIDEKLGANPLAELEGEGVLPLQLGTLEGGVSVHAGLPLDRVAELPLQVYRELRTEVVLGMMTLIDAEAAVQLQQAGVLKVIGKGSEVEIALQAMVAPIYAIVHTYRYIDIERSQEMGIELRVVALIVMHEL